VHGLGIVDILRKYETVTRSSLFRWIKNEGWEEPIKKKLDSAVKDATTMLSAIGFSGEEIKAKIKEAGEDKNLEFELIETLKFTLLGVALGKYSKVKSIYSLKDDSLTEVQREVTTIPPDVRASAEFFRIDELLASFQDIGEYETDEELEARYKRYREEKIAEREKFMNRKIDE